MNFASNTRQIRERYWVLSGKNSASSIPQWVLVIYWSASKLLHAFLKSLHSQENKNSLIINIEIFLVLCAKHIPKNLLEKGKLFESKWVWQALYSVDEQIKRNCFFFIQQIYYIPTSTIKSCYIYKHICSNTEKQQQLLFKKRWIKQLIDITMQRCPCKGAIFFMGHVALTTHYLLCHVKYL